MVRLMKQENMLKMQNGSHVANINKAFFSQSFGNAKDMKRKDEKKGDFDYIKKLKKKTKCNICMELGH